MATDLACLARHPAAPGPDDPDADLVGLAHRHSRAVIDAELHRLARRLPALSRDDLNAIDAVLEGLAESLILARLRTARQDAAPLLTRLFGS
jgi:hypothetical protein